MVQDNQNRLIINDVLKLGADISVLYLNKKFSDVNLVVEEEKFPAHKVILAARSQFFETLLFSDDKQISKNEHSLTGITCETLKKILKYIYTGTISVESTHIATDLEVLSLASQYHIDDLKTPMVTKIKKLIDEKNVFTILDTANLYHLQDLIDTCYNFLDIHAWELKSNDGFANLSQVSIKNLLIRDTFVLPEINIFEIVVKWRKFNTDHNDLVINCVRFEWMSVVDIVSKVWPTKIMQCEKLFAGISEIVKIKPKSRKLRVQSGFDTNLATVINNSRVIGNTTQNLLNGNKDSAKFTGHIIGNKSGITIKLGSLCSVNNINLKLYDADSRSYMYYIEMSIDEENWTRVIDYSTYSCRSDQNLYFEGIMTRFIRIVGTYNTVNEGFHLVFLEAFYQQTVPKLIGSIIVPTSNVATLDKKAVVIEGIGANAIIDGNFTKFDGSTGFTYHMIGSGSIIIQLAQPYMISSMKLLLWNGDSRFYKYYIETSTNKLNWEMAIDRRNEECKSWQNVTFSERATVFIKLTGTKNSANEGFHCVHLECPSPSPVK